MFGNKSTPTDSLIYTPPQIIDGRRMVVNNADVVKEGADLWRYSLVGLFVEGKMPYSVITRIVK